MRNFLFLWVVWITSGMAMHRGSDDLDKQLKKPQSQIPQTVTDPDIGKLFNDFFFKAIIDRIQKTGGLLGKMTKEVQGFHELSQTSEFPNSEKHRFESTIQEIIEEVEEQICGVLSNTEDFLKSVDPKVPGARTDALNKKSKKIGKSEKKAPNSQEKNPHDPESYRAKLRSFGSKNKIIID